MIWFEYRVHEEIDGDDRWYYPQWKFRLLPIWAKFGLPYKYDGSWFVFYDNVVDALGHIKRHLEERNAKHCKVHVEWTVSKKKKNKKDKYTEPEEMRNERIRFSGATATKVAQPKKGKGSYNRHSLDRDCDG